MCEEGNGLSASYIFSCELIMLFELVIMCLFFSFFSFFVCLPTSMSPSLGITGTYYAVVIFALVYHLLVLSMLHTRSNFMYTCEPNPCLPTTQGFFNSSPNELIHGRFIFLHSKVNCLRNQNNKYIKSLQKRRGLKGMESMDSDSE
ncbi:hypothetical protein NC652_000081 [Populus alba x Populus x berolinensis]|uniref:Uncharacterized protein n=1 Tax=Populus alba x Populus x berolinensis TaxID=444605 RepID=A0AAD6RK38_9ROSI|nr:hypothetical protein NC652_000077 [Populus alba x Populus x berolinensis]KAJ6961080.1 hypothetical protein NC652_000081 [Populus alba x Populus x berolinensis]KAJ7010246.1 hypothetical protein NC653_000861 [Populus alba x Populus x berolinensis]